MSWLGQTISYLKDYMIHVWPSFAYNSSTEKRFSNYYNLLPCNYTKLNYIKLWMFVVRALLNLVKSWISTLNRLIKWIIYRTLLKVSVKTKERLLYIYCIGRNMPCRAYSTIDIIKQINKLIFFIKFVLWERMYALGTEMTLSKYIFFYNIVTFLYTFIAL